MQGSKMTTSKKVFRTMDEYIATFPKNIQSILEELREAIRESAPKAEETISYQMPAFKLSGILVWFAAFKIILGFILRPQLLRHSKRNCLIMK